MIHEELKSEHISHLALLSRILTRKQSVMFMVNLFQLGKQVGPQRTKQVFESFDCLCQEWIIFISVTLGNKAVLVQTKHFLDKTDNYLLRMKVPRVRFHCICCLLKYLDLTLLYILYLKLPLSVCLMHGYHASLIREWLSLPTLSLHFGCQ